MRRRHIPHPALAASLVALCVAWAQPAEQSTYIHHVAENLADWLHAVTKDGPEA